MHAYFMVDLMTASQIVSLYSTLPHCKDLADYMLWGGGGVNINNISVAIFSLFLSFVQSHPL